MLFFSKGKMFPFQPYQQSKDSGHQAETQTVHYRAMKYSYVVCILGKTKAVGRKRRSPNERKLTRVPASRVGLELLSKTKYLYVKETKQKKPELESETKKKKKRR